ncbi:hypothetical protein JMM61_18725 [Rhodovulum sulfidophilum]|uniref:hypothetical protein n=1 Tax=Rhodovulum sulfidophilum TaxID=35806 RepID=UPI001925EA24|nr:hypothetical protein [Rhodovulum sulfidophilum]MBL3587388.1 hypothetical protein [Rhodovulum sulfidophilum]
MLQDMRRDVFPAALAVGHGEIDLDPLNLMLDRVTTIAHEMAAVAADRRDALAADILGEMLSNIDMNEILERAQSRKFEQTEAEIAEAIARAQAARQAEVDILQYAAASQTQVTGGFEGRHMVSFIRSMGPYAGYAVRQSLHEGKTLEIQLSEELLRAWPEFGRRSVLRLTVDHERARQDRSLILMDFESAFVRELADPASDRLAFDGLYGEAEWAFNALLTVHRIRWQDLSGQLLEEDLLPVLSRGACSRNGSQGIFSSSIRTSENCCPGD